MAVRANVRTCRNLLIASRTILHDRPPPEQSRGQCVFQRLVVLGLLEHQRPRVPRFRRRSQDCQDRVFRNLLIADAGTLIRDLQIGQSPTVPASVSLTFNTCPLGHTQRIAIASPPESCNRGRSRYTAASPTRPDFRAPTSLDRRKWANRLAHEHVEGMNDTRIRPLSIIPQTTCHA